MPERPHHAESLWPIAVLIALLALVPTIATALDDPFLLRFFTRVVVFAIAAVALNIALGYGALVSLAHAAFMGLGGYAVGILSSADVNAEPLIRGFITIGGTSNLLIAVPVAVLSAAVFAAVIGAICLRTSGMYFIMITLAFNQMLYYVFVAWQRFGGEDGLQIMGDLNILGFDPTGRTTFFYICVGALALTPLFVNRLVQSPFGMVLRGAAQSEKRMTVIGVPVFSYRLAGLIVSGAITGFAGALLAISQKFVSPVDLSWIRSADLVVMAVLGGISVTWGPVLGAVAFFAAELLLSSKSVYWNLYFGIFIIAVALLLPGGIARPPVKWPVTLPTWPRRRPSS